MKKNGNKKGKNMKEIINKVMPSLVSALIIAVITAWFTSSRRLEENYNSITKLSDDIEKIEKSHTRRLENLEYSREKMPDYYVTRREFNVIIEALDEKMNKVDKNVEKLLDLQMMKNKG